MSNRVKTNMIKYGTCTVVTVLLMLAYLLPRDFRGAALQDQYRMLCDAFFIPGILLILAGALVWVAGEGAFHGISYCLRIAAYALIPGKRKDAYEKYGDYVERKSRNKVSGYGFLFYYGMAVMALSLVFLLLYNFR